MRSFIQDGSWIFITIRSSSLFKMMLFHFAWHFQCVPGISVQCHVELSCSLACLLDLNIKLRRLHHPYLLHIAIAMMPATFLNKATICSYSTRKLPDWQHYVKFLLRKSSKLHSFVLITICFNTSRQNLCNFHPNSFRDCLHCTEMTSVILFPSLTSGVKGCSLGVAVAQAWRLEGPDTQEGLG